MVSFLEIDNESQVARLSELVRLALCDWSLDDAEVDLIKYRENAVFAIRSTTGERFVMRVHRPGYRSDQQILSEIEWSAALRESGIFTPEVVPTTAGDLLSIVEVPGVPEARQCDLIAWVDGDPLGTLEGGVSGDEQHVRGCYKTLGKLAGRIHAHGRSWRSSPNFDRPHWSIAALIGDSPTFGRFWELDCMSQDQLQLLLEAQDKARGELGTLDRSSASYGLIHGDFLPENILVSGGRTSLIDFDDCGSSWYAFELATALFPILSQANAEQLRDAYVEGYQRIRTLPDEQLAAMPAMLMARSLSYLGWPAGRREMEEGQLLAPILVEITVSLARRYLADESLFG